MTTKFTLTIDGATQVMTVDELVRFIDETFSQDQKRVFASELARATREAGLLGGIEATR